MKLKCVSLHRLNGKKRNLIYLFCLPQKMVSFDMHLHTGFTINSQTARQDNMVFEN